MLAAIVVFGGVVPAYSSGESIAVSIDGSPYLNSVNAVTVSLSGFSDASYQVTVKFVDSGGLDAPNGTMAQTHTTGLSAISGYSVSSGAKIGFSGTLANIETALGTLVWTPASTGSGNQLQVSVGTASTTETFTVAAAISPTVTASIPGTPRVGSEGAVSVLLGGFSDASYQVTVKFVDSGGLDAPNGTMAQTHTTGLSAISGYSVSSGAKIGFSGTLADIRFALATLTWTPGTAGAGNLLQVSVTTAPGANQYFSSSTDRYYEFVSGEISQTAAKTAAAAKTLFGMNGYLAHITTAAENEFVANETSATSIWIGATDSATEGDWKWDGAVVTGDQTSLGNYVFFRESSTNATGYANWGLTVTGNSAITFSHAAWNDGEPNNSGGEDCAVTNWNGAKGEWNDLPCSKTSDIGGYLVEYGGLSGTSTAVSASGTLSITVGDAVAIEEVSEIWTDFDGYWNSSTSDAAVGVASYALDFPDESHDLIGFTWDGTTYSTGVEDATLTSNSVTFTPDVWSALPIDEISYSFACSAAGSNGFGVAVGATESAPSKSGSCYSAVENASFLTSGTQGLNLGEALVNVPSGNAIDFTVTSITDGEIDDGVPDILFTQIAQASSSAGQTISLLDEHGRLIGNKISFSGTQVSNVSPTGFWDAAVFRMSGSSWPGADGQKAMRMFALELADLGVGAANSGNVVTVRWESTSTNSDIAFLGYNTTALSVENVATVPGQPTGLTATGSGPTTADSAVAVTVSLSWTAPASDGGAPLTDYVIEYRVGSGSWQTFSQAASVSTTASITGLTGLDDVEFRVSADNSGYSGPGITGVGAASSSVSLDDWVCTGLDEFDALGEISELTLWLRADCLTGTPTSLSDGSSFSTWSDLSGEDHDALTLAGKLNPTLQSDSGSLINGEPVAYFSRTTGSAGNASGGTVLDVAGVDLRKIANPDVSLFVVYEPERSVADDSDTGEAQGLWGIDNGGWDRFFLSEYSGSGWGDDGLISLGPTQSVASNGGVNTIGGAGEDGTPRLLTAVYDGEQTSGGTPPSNASSIYFRDTLVTSFTDTTNWSAAQTSLSIGWDGDNNPFRGKIAEFIIFNDALDSSVPTIQNYLRDKYELQRTPVDGQVPDVLVLDPRAQNLSFPALTLTDSVNAMVCFSQVADSSGNALAGTATITVGRTSATAGVTENIATNSWRYSGARASVQAQTASIQISGTGSNSVVSSGSIWLRVNITADPTDQSACTASGVEVDEIVEIRSLDLGTKLNVNVNF